MSTSSLFVKQRITARKSGIKGGGEKRGEGGSRGYVIGAVILCLKVIKSEIYTVVVKF